MTESHVAKPDMEEPELQKLGREEHAHQKREHMHVFFRISANIKFSA